MSTVTVSRKYWITGLTEEEFRMILAAIRYYADHAADPLLQRVMRDFADMIEQSA
jgi:hypothetical protein